MSTQSAMVELGSVAPAFELMDVVTGKALGRDDAFSLAADAETPYSAHALPGAPQHGMPGLLVMFLCVHCPYVKHIEQELGRLGRDYKSKIAIVAISANDVATYPEDAPGPMKLQAERLGWRFPYVFDETQEVARSYGAACTPDFFLFNAERKLVYRGQFDGSRPPRGHEPGTPAIGADLRAAMDDVIAGKHPDPNQRSSVGCGIKWRATS